MQRKKLVFDMDGTLLNSMFMWHNFMDLYENFDPNKNEKSAHIGLPNLTKSSALANSIKRVKNVINDGRSEDQIAEKIHAFLYDFYTAKNRAKANVENTIRNLHGEGYEIYLATATDYCYALEGIRRANILDYFKKIYTPDQLGLKKYDINYYKTISEELEAKPKEIIFFDDASYALNLAKEADFIAVGVHDELSDEVDVVKEVSDYFIEDFSEITKILDQF